MTARSTPTAPPRSRARRVMLGLLSGAAITGATIVLLEGGASLALFAIDFLSANAPRVFRPHTATDTLLGWVNRPGFSSPDEFGPGIRLTTTPQGLRTTAHPPSDAPNERRIVCSGDSFTMGYGVADTKAWCSLLSDGLPGVATANMGQGGYGLDQAYLWYRRDGAALGRHLQILGITDVMLERSQTGNHMGRFKPFFTLEGGHLALHNVPVPVQTEQALRRAYSVRVLDDLRLLQVIRRVLRVDGTRRAAQQVDDRWPLTEAILGELAASDQARQVPLVIVYLPTRRDLRPGPLDARRKRLAEFSAKHGVGFLDLTPALRTLRADSLDLAFITRTEPGAAPGVAGHYSNLGNVWVAKQIATHLGTLP